MELESTNSGPTAKLPILKLGEYEMWVIRIKQYFQIQDYALWELIENVECYNFHKLGHFSIDAEQPRSKKVSSEIKTTTRTRNHVDISQRQMLAIDGVVLIGVT
ncbi:hypothetical protein Tco_0558460 [Tanacetum coccineum]